MVTLPPEQGHFGKMTQQSLVAPRGKKMDYGGSEGVQSSCAQNMYPRTTDKHKETELFFRRTNEDYNNKHGVAYQPPPVVKAFDKKHSFVHNCIENKNKTNIAHFENIYNKRVFNSNKANILRKLHSMNMDFRKLTNLKNTMFDSDDLRDNQYVPMQAWTETVQYLCPGGLDGVEDMILDEIREGDEINLSRFNDIVDLFIYLPVKNERNSNDSSNLFMVMSSNTRKGFSACENQGGIVKKMLDLLWIKISEKYNNIAEAYRYFDVNFNNRVSFNEFQKALDHLRIKY